MKTVQIIGFEYSTIDESGIIRNSQGIRKTYVSRGYEKIILTKNNKSTLFSVHRLVALHFVPNPHNKAFVNHKDGNKLNNHASNLEWVTKSENTYHAYETGLLKKYVGADSPCSKKIYQICINTNKVIAEHACISELERNNGYSNISRAAKNNRIAHGYKWSYTK